MNTLRALLRDKSPRGAVQLSSVAQGQEQLSHVLSQSRSSRWLDSFQQNYKTGEHKNITEPWSQLGNGCSHLSGQLFKSSLLIFCTSFHMHLYSQKHYANPCSLPQSTSLEWHKPQSRIKYKFSCQSINALRAAKLSFPRHLFCKLLTLSPPE